MNMGPPQFSVECKILSPTVDFSHFAHCPHFHGMLQNSALADDTITITMRVFSAPYTENRPGGITTVIECA